MSDNKDEVSVGEQSNSAEAEIESKLKGDAIGSTMYTERFVLKTILKLKDLEWNEELEDDLCFLWDSSVEKEICEYLMDVNFPLLACRVLAEYDTVEYGRLTEILVGTIANIVIAKCSKTLEKDQIHIILNLLVSSDTLVLVQVMRFIITFSYNSNNLNILRERSDDLDQSIRFVFRSTTNYDLILKTLQALSKMSDDSKITKFFTDDLLHLAVAACTRLITADEENEFELFTREQRTATKNLIEYILNFTLFIKNADNDTIVGRFRSCSNVYVEFFTKVCKWFSFQENLLPVTDEILFYFDGSNYIFQMMMVEYNSTIFKHIFTISKILLANKCEEIYDIIELCCYFLKKGRSEQLKLDLQSIDHSEIVCNFLDENGFKFNFDKEKLKEIID